ncbi:hypothetical protein GDO86_009638 [Hymenochirus boettgeri]|uniref:Uncharacterized protein n=1 Tax=Hymenochirus boettgeri TaxID=247094 RepID=A0A8T2JLE1_9PIPI|nr:hypothetical protein GDO86_009638 [Hymenochirus boettgeri]
MTAVCIGANLIPTREISFQITRIPNLWNNCSFLFNVCKYGRRGMDYQNTQMHMRPWILPDYNKLFLAALEKAAFQA